MLQRAASSHKPPPSQGKGSSLSQPSLSKSSRLGQTPTPKQGPLQPSPSASVNRSFGSVTGYKNPLKRTVSEVNNMSRSYSTFSSTGIVDKLHGDVMFDGFDENEFPPDSELNFDDDDSPIQTRVTKALKPSPSDELYPNLSKPSAPPTDSLYPTLPPPKKSINHSNSKPVTTTPIRSSQIEWSSSPLANKATPPNAHLLNRRNPDTVDLTQESPVYEEEKIIPTKRSKLPWGTNIQLDGKAEIVDKLVKGKSQVSGGFTTETPNSKVKNEPTQAWNKTASAIKEEQKRHRQSRGAVKWLPSKDIPASQGTIKKQKKTNKRMAKVFLSDEQKSVLELVKEKDKSVFFTGSAGTGKSVLMRHIITELKSKYREPDRVAVTASTGLAACNIGGVTLHSFAGIGLGKEPVEQLVKKIKRNAKTKTRWQRTKVLVVDEISMVDGDLFDKLENVARIIRGNGRPFGGIQLVVTGDFFQLPPVPEPGKPATFSFDASTWKTCIQHTIGLTHVYRQRDEEFASMLNETRVGQLSAASIAKFKVLSRKPQDDGFIDATDLYPTRREVYRANHQKMNMLGGESVNFQAVDGGTIVDTEQRKRLLNNCMAEEVISLKKGAQVMLIKNLDETLVNGSIGRVIAFMDEKTYDVYHESEEDIFKFEQDVAGGHTEGRAKIKSMMNQDHSTPGVKWPLVRFKLADGTSRDLLCNRETWKIELPNGEIQAQRNQVPLILAWALSIHKAQGQTLEHVRVNLLKIFEKGQAYVALSRATSREGLQVLNFDASKVQAHARVTTFYNSLYSVDVAYGQGGTAINVKSKAKRSDLDSYSDEDDDADLLALEHS